MIQDRLQCWCLHQVGWGVQSLFYWGYCWCQGLIIFEYIFISPPVQHSCGKLWTSGFHAVYASSLWIGHRAPSAWGLAYYHLDGSFLSHPIWVIRVWCGRKKVYEWTCCQNGFHGHHRREPVDWAYFLHIQSWNASFTSSIDTYPYTQMVYYGLPILWEC